MCCEQAFSIDCDLQSCQIVLAKSSEQDSEALSRQPEHLRQETLTATDKRHGHQVGRCLI